MYITPQDYAARVAKVFDDKNLLVNIQRASDLIERTIKSRKVIYVCGNGGSAAIANHLVCDCQKGISTNTMLYPKIVSLSSNVPVITAIANDIGYESVFSHQLNNFLEEGDLLLTISSSGNSPNIKKAIETALANEVNSVAFCGFSGGSSYDATIPVHVKENNYGIVEDCHQMIMHMIAQNIRHKNLLPDVANPYPF